MMTGGRDEELMQCQVMKDSSVMFPRLRVDEREKGGPRAPPRNKMALYEQFSVPLIPTRTSCGGSASTSNNYTFASTYNVPETSGSARRRELLPFSGVGFCSMTEANEPSKPAGKAPAPSLPVKPCSAQQQYEHFPKMVNSVGIEVMSLPKQHQSKTISFHRTNTSEPGTNITRLGLIELESGRLRGIPLPQFPLLRATPPFTMRPPVKKEVEADPQVLERPQEFLSRNQKDYLTLQQLTTEGSQSSAIPPHKEGIHGTSGKLEDARFSGSSQVSPDDVQKLIGHKGFWKARQAILDQQRIFSAQLFELHRLIKVQCLISRSRHSLSEYGGRFRNSALASPPEFRLPMRLNSETEEQNATGRHPLHAGGIEMRKVPASLQPNKRPCSGNIPEPDENTNLLGMPCYPTTGNQWLMPIVSPSEGLVYKPYNAPDPPGTRIMAPVTSDPIKLGIGYGKEYPNTSLELSSLPLQYVPPQGTSVMNFLAPSHTPESTNFTGLWKSEVPSEKVNPKRELEKRTGFSSPGKGEPVLPLFPTTPDMDKGGVLNKGGSNESEKQQTRVIKVIPYCSKWASESTARILKLILEEREQLPKD